MPSPPHTLQACLTPTKTSCQADASACSSGQVCCPLTKVRSPHEAPPLRSRMIDAPRFIVLRPRYGFVPFLIFVFRHSDLRHPGQAVRGAPGLQDDRILLPRRQGS